MAVAKGPLEGGREGGRREGGRGRFRHRFFIQRYGLAIYACVCVSCKLLTKCFKTRGERPVRGNIAIWHGLPFHSH